MIKQFLITPSSGKRLIGKGIANHPDIERVMKNGTLLVIAGTTNGYVVEEIMKKFEITGDFSRKGFRRGITTAPNSTTNKYELKGDILFRKGEMIVGKTIFDIIDDLKMGDIILKGANAFDVNKKPAVLIGHSKAGTIGVGVQAVIGRRVKMIVPVGLEKRIIGDIDEIARLCNSTETSGLRLFQMPGDIFTEIEAINTLSGAEGFMVAAGSIYGAEGSVWIGVRGDKKQLEATELILKECEKEPLCEV
jgi:hypothetical protein